MKTINKESWSPGPWHNEPDFEEFQYQGYQCKIKRNPGGSLCGYVELPIDHKLSKFEHYWDIPLEVHGGITFGQTIVRPATEESFFVIGFDCGHADDLIPGGTHPVVAMIQGLSGPGATYKDIEFVRQQIRYLVDQIEESNEQQI